MLGDRMTHAVAAASQERPWALACCRQKNTTKKVMPLRAIFRSSQLML